MGFTNRDLSLTGTPYPITPFPDITDFDMESIDKEGRLGVMEC